MRVSFEKTDRLIELLEDSHLALTGYSYMGAYDLRNGIKSKANLYSELVDITQSNTSEEEKNLQRIKAFAKAYGHGNDMEVGEKMLKYKFDENEILQSITKRYWQINQFCRLIDESGNNFSDNAKVMAFIEKHFPDEPYKETVIDAIKKQAPLVNEIENEFWANCTEIDKINDWCKIYHERFKNHLREVDEKFYENVLDGFDKNNLFHQYFQDLRITGLLQEDCMFVEARLYHIAANINILNNSINELFFRLRASTQNSSDSTDDRDYSALYQALSKYISGISCNEFSNIISHHSLSPGSPKALWTGYKADAWRFADCIGIKATKFNKCFSFIDGKTLEPGHRDKNGTSSDINAILKNFFCK